jgi:putative tryptophan/tyrosine transport system substrate-binding protein
VKRRTFIAGFGSAVAWPMAAWAQQGERVRRVGILVYNAENDPEIQAAIAAFRQELIRLGWFEDRNLRLDVRFGTGEPERIRAQAAELVNFASDVIVAAGPPIGALQRLTHTIPIVSTGFGDSGQVKNIARPEGNLTGVTNFYASVFGKLVELLKDAAPEIKRIGYVYHARIWNPDEGTGYFAPVGEAAHTLRLQMVNIPYADVLALVRDIDAFADEPNGGLIISPPSPPKVLDTISRLVIRHRLPSISAYISAGGWLAYNSSLEDRWSRAASFVDRLLRGAKVAELPLEFPTRFKLVVNLKAVKAMGLSISESLLARADEVIE